MEALTEALQATVATWRGRFPAPLSLQLYTSSNFIGLFVEEQVAEVLKSFAAEFATEAASKAGAWRHIVHINSPTRSGLLRVQQQLLTFLRCALILSITWYVTTL